MAKERHRETGGDLSKVSGTIFVCQAFIAPVVFCRVSAASSAEGVSVRLTAPDLLTCGGQPKSHQSLGMRAARCGPQTRREAGEGGSRRSERPAEECFHTSRSPAEERRGEDEGPGLSE